MRVNRTYPTPDTKRKNCGPRERALATFKYLLDLEPEEAVRHPRFALMVNAFEQQSRVAVRKFLLKNECVEPIAPAHGDPSEHCIDGWFGLPDLLEPLEEELTSGERAFVRRPRQPNPQLGGPKFAPRKKSGPTIEEITRPGGRPPGKD